MKEESFIRLYVLKGIQTAFSSIQPFSTVHFDVNNLNLLLNLITSAKIFWHFLKYLISVPYV